MIIIIINNNDSNNKSNDNNNDDNDGDYDDDYGVACVHTIDSAQTQRCFKSTYCTHMPTLRRTRQLATVLTSASKTTSAECYTLPMMTTTTASTQSCQRVPRAPSPGLSSPRLIPQPLDSYRLPFLPSISRLFSCYSPLPSPASASFCSPSSSAADLEDVMSNQARCKLCIGRSIHSSAFLYAIWNKLTDYYKC